MAPSEDIFDGQNQLRADGCFIAAKDRENERIVQYVLQPGAYGAPDVNACPVRTPRPDLDHRNLRIKQRGYGVADGCVINADSAIRNNLSAMTNPNEKHQLFARQFQAAPDLNSGIPRPDIESRLLQGELDVSRACTGGVTWDRPFIDMLPCVAAAQTAEHTVTSGWTWGGEPPRDYVRRPDGCQMLRPAR